MDLNIRSLSKYYVIMVKPFLDRAITLTKSVNADKIYSESALFRKKKKEISMDIYVQCHLKLNL